MNVPEAKVRVRGVAELIALLPHQFGYQPRQSLVVVLLGQPVSDGGPAAGTLLLTMRLDVPAPEATEAVVREVRALCAREQPFGVQFLAFTDEREDEHAVHALRLLGQGCDEDGIVVDVLAQVTGGLWCRRTALHEPSVTPSWARVPAAADVPAAAELVFRGSSPLPDRESYGRALDADLPLTHRAVLGQVRALAGEPGTHLALRALQLWGTVLRTSDTATPVAELGAQELALLVGSLWDVLFRDCLLAWVAPEQFTDLASSARDPGTAARYLALQSALAAAVGPDPVDPDVLSDRLVTLCSRTPRRCAVPVLTILAVHAWAKGQGTLANVAVERALAVDPDYRMARLLDQALTAAVRPRRFAQHWRDHVAGLDPDAA